MQEHRQVLPRWILALGLAAALSSAAAAQTSDDEIDAAIAAGIENVWRHQQPSGRWGEYDWAGGHHYPWGLEAICLLTLEFADVDLNDERYQKGLKLFLEAEPEQNYERCCRTMILAHLTRRTKGDKQAGYREALKRDVLWIERAQGSHGGWTYTSLGGGNGTHDFSNSQMAVLALSEAILSNVEVSREVLAKAQGLFLKARRADGGWNYRLNDDKTESYGSMTAAAVATLFITRDYLSPQVGCPCSGGRSPRRTTAVDEAIDGGIKWLSENFEPASNPKYRDGWWARYWLYSVARVGIASGYKYIGTHRWYREGAGYACQSTTLGGKNLPFACLATLFLIKGKAPLLYNKLRWDGPWNLHPRDLANLTQYISKVKEQPVGWQVVPVTAPLEEWHEAPILYISAEEKIDFTDEQKARLKQFTETGGTIFFEASCSSRTTRTWWENLCKELWPDYEFERIGDEHPLWTADVQIQSRRKPVLFGLDDGLRTFVFMATVDLSCTWQTVAQTRNIENYQLGGNLYMYASDRKPIRRDLARGAAARTSYASASVSAGSKGELTVARLKTGGDYYAGQRYRPLERYDELKASGAPLVKAVEPVAPADLDPAKLDAAWLTGRQGAELSDEAVAALKKYLAGGGFLFAEAAMGDERFAKSFEALAARLGLKVDPWKSDEMLVTGRFNGAAGYDISGVRYTSHLKAKRIGQTGPVLSALYLAEKLVGVWSAYDVTFSQTGCPAFGNLGYEPDDARAILTNILLLAGNRDK